jgi:DNA (cytosine-5)-methyltransferase 1
VTQEQTNALVAQDHGNHPAVLQAAGFSTEHSAQSRSIGYEQERSPTLRAGVVPAALSIENHPADSRVSIREDETCQTLCGRAGTGGGNVPMVAVPVTLKIRSGCDGGGKGALIQRDKSATLGCSNDQTLFQPPPETYDVRFTSAGTQNARGHCYPTDISRCLDTGGENPDSNHGGVCVVESEPTYALQGSMIGRADYNGPQGDGVNENVCFTLNCTDRHAVAAASEDNSTYCATTGHFMTVEKEKSNTLVARDYKDPQIVNDTPNQELTYIVRRLTPVECGRLQGFPDWWCEDLAISDPTEEELSFWTQVWETWSRLNGKKPKTEAQVRKWLANPYKDSAAYKMWGNGLCLANSYFVLAGIAWAEEKE